MNHPNKTSMTTALGRTGLACTALAGWVVLAGSALAQTPPDSSPDSGASARSAPPSSAPPGAPSGPPPGYGPPSGGPPGDPGGAPGDGPSAFPGQGQPGDDQAYAMMPPPLPPTVPKPAENPHDLEGTWFHDEPLQFRITKDEYSRKLPYTPKGKAIIDRRVKATYQDGSPYSNASAACLPPGQQWQMDLNMPFQVYQTPKEIDFIFEEYHGVWKIRMNQPHRTTGPREYMGDSVGHWDGSTLVVDTIGYKLPLWLDVDGTPASANARVVSRIRKIDYGVPKLEVTTTVYDPALYNAPWSIVRTFAWRPDMASFNEYNCEHQVGAAGGVARYGLAPEPPEDYSPAPEKAK